MESSGAVYARVPAGGLEALEAAMAEARAASRHSSPLGVLAFDPTCHTFAIVDRWGRSDSMPIWSEATDLAVARELVVLSRLAGEVVAFYEIEEGEQLGVYGAWRDGALVRELCWYETAWTKVVGEPQEWESPLFSAESLERALGRARDDGLEEAEVRAAFSAGRIAEGGAWPRPERLPVHIRTVHRGPAHGFQPWPRRAELVSRNRQAQS
jgi:hypothetical protein